MKNTVDRLLLKISNRIGEDYHKTPRTNCTEDVLRIVLKQICKGGVVSWGYEELTDDFKKFMEMK